MKNRNPVLLLTTLAALFAAPSLATMPPGSKLQAPPGPVQPLAPLTRCYAWVMAYEGQTCPEIAGLLGITLEQFMDWNPQLWNDCARNLWGGYYYCVIQDPVS